MLTNELKPIESINDLERKRNQLAEMIGDLDRLLKETSKACEQIGVGFHYLEKAIAWYSSEPCIGESFLKEADGRLWKSVIDTCGVSKVLPCAEVTKLYKEIDANPPPFTATAAREVVNRVCASSGGLAMMAVRKVFDQLVTSNFRKGNSWYNPKEQRSKNRIEKKFRFSHFGAINGWSGLYPERFDLFNDLERVCHLVNASPAPDYPKRLGDTMCVGLRNYDTSKLIYSYQTQFFKVQLFKNGNIYLEFLCDETLQRINLWGADESKLPETSLFN